MSNVVFHNGQYYANRPLVTGGLGSILNYNNMGDPSYGIVPGLSGLSKQIGAPTQGQQSNQGTGMFGDPFGTAMSGNERGTLQPYINRMTQNASNALYGGLLNYSPQSMVAGSAGGTPQNSTVPQFDIQSALKGMQGQSLGFGNRSWMNRG